MCGVMEHRKREREGRSESDFLFFLIENRWVKWGLAAWAWDFITGF